LKIEFAANRILAHQYKPQHQFIMETDASDAAIGCVLSQLEEKGHKRTVAFYSRSLLQSKINYNVLEKELLAIKSAFEQWHHHLEGANKPTVVLTDHKNLVNMKNLSCFLGTT
jgi:hypothetical protein